MIGLRVALSTALALLLLQTAMNALVIGAAQALPGGEIIAFSAQGRTTQDIYIQDLSAGIVRNITSHIGSSRHETQPAWSPDGRQIVFASSADTYAPTDLYVIDMDGRNLRRLTDFPGGEFSPAWSPDGRRIAFVSYRLNNLDISVMDADGSHVRQLTDSPLIDDSPAWSPDGRQIAFHSTRYGVDGSVVDTIYVMDADGSNERRLIEGYHSPAWSPDGTQMALLSGWEGHLYVMDVADGKLSSFDITGLQSALAWLPESRRIAYVSTRCFCLPEVYVLDMERGIERRLYYGGVSGYIPAWRPT